MSYQVLARKWRPQSFENMIGQEPILRMLTNALIQKRLHHAYLFTGTRGVGKTTLARILAKCLNCEVDVTATPCHACAACQAIDTGKFLDLYEIDAASRTKVEDTRELLENVIYPPVLGRFKIYLIDEVHMLSNHSFNALLKTLEEPPTHVKFLLATTDPKRLPATILSRCLTFNLKRITPLQIANHLQQICGAEAIENEMPALLRLAKAADGSMRDALSLLDQAIAYGRGSVNKMDVDVMLGSMSQDEILPLLQAIAAKDGKQLIDRIRFLSENAPDFEQVLEEIISLLHQIAIIQIVPDELGDTNVKMLSEQLSSEEVQLYYQIALLCRRDLSLAPSPQEGFEMSMLRMLAFTIAKNQVSLSSLDNTTLNNTINNATSKSLLSTSEAINQHAGQADVIAVTASNNLLIEANTPKKIAALKEPTALKEPAALKQTITSSSSLLTEVKEWREILGKLELTGMAYALASNCTLGKLTENKIELMLSASHHPMLNAKLKDRIKESLNRYFKKNIQLDISITTSELATPQKKKDLEQKKQLENAIATVQEDPQIKRMIAAYDATVLVSLIS